MNVIVKPGSETAKGIAETPRVSVEERGRRKAAVEYARASVRLEGFELSEFAEDLNRRYVDGEITREQKTAALLTHHQP